MVQERPVNRALLAFLPMHDKPSSLVFIRVILCAFLSVRGYWRWLDAAWTRHGDRWAPSAASLTGRSRARFTSSNGWPYRTIPPGVAIDWHHPDVQHSLDLATSEVTITRGVSGDGGGARSRPGDCWHRGVAAGSRSAVTHGGVGYRHRAPSAGRGQNSRTCDKGEGGISPPPGGRKREGCEDRRAQARLTAEYLEDWLRPWGIWPLGSFE